MFGLADLGALGPFLLDDSQKPIVSFLPVAAWLAVDLSLQLLELFVDDFLCRLSCLVEQSQIHWIGDVIRHASCIKNQSSLVTIRD